jgi:hypothetical protein
MRRVVLGTSFAHCHHGRAPDKAARAFWLYIPVTKVLGIPAPTVTKTGPDPDKSG